MMYIMPNVQRYCHISLARAVTVFHAVKQSIIWPMTLAHITACIGKPSSSSTASATDELVSEMTRTGESCGQAKPAMSIFWCAF